MSGSFNGRTAATLIEFMTGAARRETGQRLVLRGKRRGVFATLGSSESAKKNRAEGETDDVANAAQSGNKAGKAEGTSA